VVAAPEPQRLLDVHGGGFLSQLLRGAPVALALPP
jgi:hypothetical protein